MDTIVIGAGVGGLRCARTLLDAGASVQILEKSRGVGGRCATRRLDGQPVDHGVSFLHGDDDRFRERVRSAAGDGLVDGWPDRVEGAGRPCNRKAFRAREWRCAIRQGVNMFAKALAEGLDVRRDVRVVAIRVAADQFVLRDASGAESVARNVVLALPAPQMAELLRTVPDPDRGIRTAVELLDAVVTEPCLTVLADYGSDAPEPDVDFWLPGSGEIVQTIVHDSAKRAGPARRILVIQGFAGWSAANRDAPADKWCRALLAEAAREVGDWVASPREVIGHRWEAARTSGASELAAPMLLRPRENGMMALTGDLFAPGGGVQGAWQAGDAIARRMLAEER